ncbi:hypothetical protein [Kutzneria albida]|uniref:hypothetical protein n=1 Tax=Kutzneria albida TaxID=43357 RepID=UPI0011DD2025|nr:hypothetical protein [Kutzneria albida]
MLDGFLFALVIAGISFAAVVGGGLARLVLRKIGAEKSEGLSSGAVGNTVDGEVAGNVIQVVELNGDLNVRAACCSCECSENGSSSGGVVD